MPDVYDPAKRSEVMRSVKGVDTGPERLVRSSLHRMGYRFRLHRSDLPGRPDIVLPKHKIVIFVHGCFWHGHPGCKHSARPRSHTDFWTRKLDRNIQRDKANIRALRRTGWRVLVIWECQIQAKREIDEIIRELMAPYKR